MGNKNNFFNKFKQEDYKMENMALQKSKSEILYLTW